MMRMLGYAKCPYPAQNSREVLYCNYKARGRVLCVLTLLIFHIEPLINEASPVLPPILSRDS